MDYYSDIPNAPQAVGPYSPAVVTGNLVFLSGQIPIDARTGKLISNDIESQTHQVLRNIRTVLQFLGLHFRQVVKTTIFLTDLSHFQTVNKIYEESLEGAKPARSTIQVAALPLGALIEIETIAVKG
jgi:2-iminobutanoate/2-iminopropanoate deaminase